MFHRHIYTFSSRQYSFRRQCRAAHHNGNLISDSGKGMTATYNHLNLPREVTVQSINGIDPGGTIQWTYDATGRKLKKISPDGITLYHSLSRIYFGNGIEKAGGGTFVYHAEGRAAFYPGNPSATPPVEDKWYYEFAMRDHPEVNSGQALGNTRITFADLNYDGYPEVNSGQAIQANPGDWIADDPHGSPVGYTEVLQENHYYPFGMNMGGPWREPEVEGKVNRYQYNGKELNSDLGLGWNDYGARWYDAAVGRFTGVDPLAEKYYSWSPFNYTLNNPVRFVDPDGSSVETEIFNAKGKKVGEDANGRDGNVAIVSKETGKQLKRGTINAEQAIGGAILTTTAAVLEESADVLERTYMNGGLAEETSVVTPDGNVVEGRRGGIARPGDAVANAGMPIVEGNDNTSIHSHVVGETRDGRGSDALQPGPDDPAMFRRFEQNVIVGKQGPLQAVNGVNIERPDVAVFFNRDGVRQAIVPIGVVNKIVKKVNQ